MNPLWDRCPDSSNASISPDRDGVGEGTVGVRVGVYVGVGVPVGWMSVGVKVKVLVGGRRVEVGWSVALNAVGVGEGVSVFVGGEVVDVDGMSIPDNKIVVALIPMKRPIDRYLMLVRMMEVDKLYN
jgi:hypothetical protein